MPLSDRLYRLDSSAVAVRKGGRARSLGLYAGLDLRIDLQVNYVVEQGRRLNAGTSEVRDIEGSIVDGGHIAGVFAKG